MLHFIYIYVYICFFSLLLLLHSFYAIYCCFSCRYYYYFCSSSLNYSKQLFGFYKTYSLDFILIYLNIVLKWLRKQVAASSCCVYILSKDLIKFYEKTKIFFFVDFNKLFKYLLHGIVRNLSKDVNVGENVVTFKFIKNQYIYEFFLLFSLFSPLLINPNTLVCQLICNIHKSKTLGA